MPAAEDQFSLWLSMAARDHSIRARIAPALGRAGFHQQAGGPGAFSGVRIGRGAGVGRVLSASTDGRLLHARRVLANTRIVRLLKSGNAVGSHLRYLARTREGEERRLSLYGPDRDDLDAKAFARDCSGDRHQFRTIVRADDGAEYEDLRPLVRRLMSQVSRDLRTPLQWAAVDHRDTGYPHSHIVIRGVDATDHDLVIAQEYLRHGFQQRAAALVSLDLGPAQAVDLERSQALALARSIERPTAIDRELVGLIDGQGRIHPEDSDQLKQAVRLERLRLLSSMGLAHADGHGGWYVQPDLVERLAEIEWHNRMALTRRCPERGPNEQTGSFEQGCSRDPEAVDFDVHPFQEKTVQRDMNMPAMTDDLVRSGPTMAGEPGTTLGQLLKKRLSRSENEIDIVQ